MRRTRAIRLTLIAALVLVAGRAAVALAPSPLGAIFDDKKNETSKQQIIDEDAALKAIGEANPAPKPDNPEQAGPSTDPEDQPVWNEGIFQGGEDFPTGAGYSFHTVWQGVQAGMNVRVYAGSYASRETVGIVLVDYVDPISWEHTFKGPYEADIAGPLFITGAAGDELSLAGRAGATTHFDVSTLAFG